MPLIPYLEHSPQLGKGCFIAPTAWITGQALLGDNVSMFFGATIRGDINRVIVGNNTNIQENALLHTSHDLGDCVVGNLVTIGHSAIVHGCKIGNNCIIGMGAIILDQAEIGDNCIIGAGSVVTMGYKIPSNSLAFGSPARVVRELTKDETENITASANGYVTTGQNYLKTFKESQQNL